MLGYSSWAAGYLRTLRKIKALLQREALQASQENARSRPGISSVYANSALCQPAVSIPTGDGARLTIANPNKENC